MLKEMVRIVISYFALPIFLWSEAIKIAIAIAIYIYIYKVLTKVVQQTPYKLYFDKKINLGYMPIWNCPAEASQSY